MSIPVSPLWYIFISCHKLLVVDQDKRGPNISLVIPVRKKSKFYLRRKKEITGIRDTSFKNQISIESTKGKKKIDVSGQQTGMVYQRKWNFC